jgi:hypothetical protein
MKVRRIVAATALALFATVVARWTLRAPLGMDDYVHLGIARGTYPGRTGPFNLFDFVDAGNQVALVGRGISPWWCGPESTMRFLRPLSSVLAWLDYRVFGENPVEAHAHSLLWFFLAVLSVFRLHRSLLGERTAWIAALVFALSPCNAAALAWPASRSELVAIVLGAWGLSLYVRWRERSEPRDGLASTAVFASALLAGEHALGLAGYTAAFELLRPREAFARRCLGASAFVLPLAAYLALRATGHFEVAGDNWYIDPTRHFLSFARVAAVREAALLTMAWLGLNHVPADLEGWPLVVAAAVVAAVLAVVIRGALQRLEPTARRHASWLVVGSVLCTAPFLAAPPSPRLTAFPLLGVSAAVAVAMEDALARGEAASVRILLPAAALAGLHFLGAPVAAAFDVEHWTDRFRDVKSRVDFVQRRAAGRAAVNILRVASRDMVQNLALMLDGTPPPPVRMLSYKVPVRVMRIAADSIELAAPAGLFPSPAQYPENFLAFLVPDRTELPGLRIDVVERAPDRAPVRIRFRFDRDLDDPSMLWVAEGDKGFGEVTLPPVGHETRLADR